MRCELLAPAGNIETMRAAIAAGADAVYLAGNAYGARAYADNFNQKELIETIDYVHIFGRKIYLTVNTLCKEQETGRKLYDFLGPLYERGLDGVIVQDIGVVSFFKTQFPDLPIHISTQMSVTGAYGATLLERMGAVRVVPARELSLQEIRQIKENTGLEIEVFAHGALCYCYSGQCLFSSMLGERSGNRGRCAQPCRLPYLVSKENRRINDDKHQFALSPKDICTIEILPELLHSGVDSLKIEGRMKRAEYTAGVVSIYRKYLDRYATDPREYHVEAEDLQLLYDLYNRDGFSRGYYEQRSGLDMMAFENKKQGKAGRNDDLFDTIRERYIDRPEKRYLDANAKFKLGAPSQLTLCDADDDHTVTVIGAVPQVAINQPLSHKRLYEQLMKTGNMDIAFSSLQIEADDHFFLPMKSVNELRRSAAQAYNRQVTESFHRESHPYIEPVRHEQNIRNQSVVFSCQVMDELQLAIAEQSPAVTRIYVPWKLRDHAFASDKVYELALPYILRADVEQALITYLESDRAARFDGFLVRNIESLGILHSLGFDDIIRFDYQMYAWNREAQEVWSRFAPYDTVPVELDYQEICHRDNSASELITYGKIPLMFSAQCLQKNFIKCDRKSAKLMLTDRYQKKFCVKCDCDFCYNSIYNSVPVCLLQESANIQNTGASSFRLMFTDEAQERMEEVLDMAEDMIHQQAVTVPSWEYTKGHWKRKVE